MQELQERDGEPRVIREAIEIVNKSSRNEYMPKGFIKEFDAKRPRLLFLRAQLHPVIYRLDFYAALIGGPTAGHLANLFAYIPEHTSFNRPLSLTIFAAGGFLLCSYLGKRISNRILKPTEDSTLFRS